MHTQRTDLPKPANAAACTRRPRRPLALYTQVPSARCTHPSAACNDMHSHVGAKTLRCALHRCQVPDAPLRALHVTTCTTKRRPCATSRHTASHCLTVPSDRSTHTSTACNDMQNPYMHTCHHKLRPKPYRKLNCTRASAHRPRLKRALAQQYSQCCQGRGARNMGAWNTVRPSIQGMLCQHLPVWLCQCAARCTCTSIAAIF